MTEADAFLMRVRVELYTQRTCLLARSAAQRLTGGDLVALARLLGEVCAILEARLGAAKARDE